MRRGCDPRFPALQGTGEEIGRRDHTFAPYTEENDLGIAGYRNARKLCRWIGVCKTSANRAAIADRIMRDMRDRLAQQRMCGCQPIILLNIAPAYLRAEANAGIIDRDRVEPCNTAQIDQQARYR
jgi:hypothetical protein